ncbi:hypothetical protein ACFLSQ_09995 [Bacteroidota bacterium]
MNTGNNINNASNGTGLDSYFKLFSRQKVNYTLDNASGLLDKHIALGAGATAWSLKSLFSLKTLSVMVIPAVVITFILTSFNEVTDKINPKESLSNNSVIQQVQNDVPVIFSSSDDNNNEIKATGNMHKTVAKPVVNIENSESVINDDLNNIHENGTDLLADAIYEENDYTIEYSGQEYGNMESPGTNDILNDDGRLKTLFNDYIYHNGYFVSPMFKSTKMDNQNAILAGGKIGWALNREIAVGLAGYGLTHNIKTKMQNMPGTNSNDLQLGYGGVYLEYINSSNDLIHFTLNSTFGCGGYEYANYEYSDKYGAPWGVFLLIEPEANVELNLSNNMRLGLSASYRFTDIIKNSNNYDISPGVGNPEFNGMSWGFYFKYGIF